MGRAIHRKMSDEEALKEFGGTSFIFVGGTGLVPRRAGAEERSSGAAAEDKGSGEGESPGVGNDSGD